MKKVVIFSGIFMLIIFIAGIIFSENKSPRTIVEKKFQDETVNWLWREAANGNLYPFLKIDAKQLIFMDENGRVTKKADYLPESKIAASGNHHFVAWVELVGGNTISVEDKLFRYHICTWNGTENYTIERTKTYDEPLWSIYLFNDGRALLTDGGQGFVFLYEKNGDLIEQIDLFDDDVFNHEKPIDCVISESGDRFYIAAQKQPMTRESGSSRLVSGEPWIICFKETGEELWRKAIGDPTFNRFNAAPSGNLLLLSHYSLDSDDSPKLKTTIFDSEGNSLMNIPVNVRYSVFYADESLFFLADRKNLYAVNLVKKTFQKIFELPKSQTNQITEIRLDETARHVITLAAKPVFQNKRFEYVDAQIMKINFRGEKIWHIDLQQDVIIRPSIRINDSQIAVGTKSNFKIYKENHGSIK